MANKKNFFINLFFMFISLNSNAQSLNGLTYDNWRDELVLGIHFAGNQSKINDLDFTIIPEPFFVNYSMKTVPHKGFSAGAMMNYKPSFVSFQGEMEYAQLGSRLAFKNYERDFNYNMDFNYTYLNTNMMLKFYPFDAGRESIQGFFIGSGVQIGANLSPENIVYQSYGSGVLPSFGSDLEQTQQLRNVLKAKTNFSGIFTLGYEFKLKNKYDDGFKFPFIVDLRYYSGLSDVVETLPNSFNFVENKNKLNAFQLRLCYYFDIQKLVYKNYN